MGRDYTEVAAIAAVQRGGAGYEFVATLDTPAGVVQIAVPAEAIQQYAVFQRHVLLRTGFVFRYAPCEGRAAEAADENWRTFAQVVMTRLAVPAVAQPYLN